MVVEVHGDAPLQGYAYTAEVATICIVSPAYVLVHLFLPAAGAQVPVVMLFLIATAGLWSILTYAITSVASPWVKGAVSPTEKAPSNVEALETQISVSPG